MFARGAALVRDRRIASDADLGPLLESPPPDVGPDLLTYLRHMYETGGWVLLESTLADIPADLRWIFESGAIGLRELAAAHQALGITTVADIAAALEEGALLGVPGLGPADEAAFAEALPLVRPAIPRIPLGRAVALTDEILERLRSMPETRWAEAAGSVRRAQDTVGDIEIVVLSDDPAAAIDVVLDPLHISRRLHRSGRRAYFLIERVQVGVRFPEPDQAGVVLLHLTGSPRHVSELRARATAKGWQLTAHGLHRPDGRLVPTVTEAEVYAALELPHIAPEIRNGDGEIAAAADGTLPPLVVRADIRGDLHMHSSWSDGRDTVAAMAATAHALGYDYIAITDHSPHSAAARNLTVDAVKRQADEIAALREQYPDMAILHGCEVDILPDGRLDFPDWVLERFDIVLASLHERAGHGPDQLMRRYIAAMRHPLVHMLTHPTNRLVPHRPGYELDYDRLFETAAATGTIVEVDGAPAHLDLDGALARRAIAAGATVAIDSDCHRADMLARQMALGVMTARRGWVEARHVVNAGPLERVRALVARKRAGS